MDNLYATTLAGDLGQMAVYVNHQGAKSYIGSGTDATEAELVGDIDGFLIGSNIKHYTGGKDLSKVGTQGARLSDLLGKYYNVSKRGSAHPKTAGDRFTQFSLTNQANLLDQTKRFATTYAYGQGKWTGLWSSADGAHSEKAVQAFKKWLEEKKKVEVASERRPGMKTVLP
jgi:hypothetical protein